MTREIPLASGLVALVDDADFEALSRFRWHLLHGYVTREVWEQNRRTARVSMHRQIMCPTGGLVIDHINGNGLDNRRANLRTCTAAENSRNQRPIRGGTSLFKGVASRTRRGRQGWRARIGAHGRVHELGVFKTEVEAALAYDKAAQRLHGDFACLNFGPSVLTDA